MSVENVESCEAARDVERGETRIYPSTSRLQERASTNPRAYDRA